MSMTNKSVLFELGKWDVGGVERVTVVLANEFVRRGWQVAVSAFEYGNRMLLAELAPEVAIVDLSGGKWLSRAHCIQLAEVFRAREVAIVINQWCVNYAHTRFLRKAMKGTEAKLIAVHHNRPDMNKRIIDAKNPVLRFAWKLFSAINLRLVYWRSDAYIVLSPSFRKVFMDFTGVRADDRLFAVANPLTIAPDAGVAKEQVLLYVGRLEESQKRVSSVIDLWRKLCAECPDWRLEIVGDGPDRAEYERQAGDLPRVTFAGFQPPVRYYARAKVLLLPSDFEGFPLVLCEAMANGCVPVALGSYAAAYDVVTGGSGVVVDMPWDLDRFGAEVMRLMRDGEYWRRLSNGAVERAADFEVVPVVDEYLRVMKHI